MNEKHAQLLYFYFFSTYREKKKEKKRVPKYKKDAHSFHFIFYVLEHIGVVGKTVFFSSKTEIFGILNEKQSNKKKTNLKSYNELNCERLQSIFLNSQITNLLMQTMKLLQFLQQKLRKQFFAVIFSFCNTQKCSQLLDLGMYFPICADFFLFCNKKKTERYFDLNSRQISIPQHQDEL